MSKKTDTTEKFKQMQLLTTILGRKRYTDAVLAYMVSLFDSVSVEQLTDAVEYITKNATELPAMSDILEGIKAGAYHKVVCVESSKADLVEIYRRMDRDDLAMTDDEYAQHVDSFGGRYDIPGVDEL